MVMHLRTDGGLIVAAVLFVVDGFQRRRRLHTFDVWRSSAGAPLRSPPSPRRLLLLSCSIVGVAGGVCG